MKGPCPLSAKASAGAIVGTCGQARAGRYPFTRQGVPGWKPLSRGKVPGDVGHADRHVALPLSLHEQPQRQSGNPVPRSEGIGPRHLDFIALLLEPELSDRPRHQIFEREGRLPDAIGEVARTLIVSYPFPDGAAVRKVHRSREPG